MLKTEMDEHLGYHEYERSDNPDYRNGKKTKKIRESLGETEIEVPQGRNETFEPKVVKKRQKDISGIEQKIISLYAKCMTTRQISKTIFNLYLAGQSVIDIIKELAKRKNSLAHWKGKMV